MLSYSAFLVDEFGKIQVKSYKESFLYTLGKKVLNESEYELFEFAVSEGNADRLFSLMESDNAESLLESYIYEELLNEESLLDKAKAKAAAIAQKVKEKGKEALNKVSDGTKQLVKMGGDLLKPVQAILAKVAEAFKKAWDYVKQIGQKAVEKARDEVAPSIKKAVAKNPQGLTEEMTNMGSMAAWGATYFAGGAYAKLVGAGAEKAAKEDTNESLTVMAYYEASVYAAITEMIESGEETIESITEALSGVNTESLENIFEGGGGTYAKIPFISTLFNKIGHMPPFKYFHDIGEKAGKIANNTLEKVSYFVANALKGPGPFKFVVVGGVVAAIAGWAAEYGAKSGLHAIVHAVEHALHIAIPGMGFIFTAIKYIGYALLAYGLIKEIFLKEKPEEAKKLPENPEDSKEEGDKEKKEEK